MIPCAALVALALWVAPGPARSADAPLPLPTEKAEKALADVLGEELFHQCVAFLPEESRFEWMSSS